MKIPETYIIAQLQHISNQILEYNLATTYDVHGVQETKIFRTDGRG